MEGWFALGGLLTTILGGLGALAYRNEAKWPIFLKFSSNVAIGMLGSAGFTAVGLFFARLFPKDVGEMLATAINVALIGLGLLALVWFANWLREP